MKIFGTRAWIYLVIMANFVLMMPSNSHAQLVPDELIYEGQLFDSSNNPVTSQHTIRISLWRSNDYVAGDVDGLGAINTGATNYGGWYEVQNFTPAFNGSFSIKLGDGTAMPIVSFTDQKFFQIEIKQFGAADTTYELLDPTGDSGSDTEDRQQIGSVLYSKSSDRLQEREIGLTQGDIPVLGFGGRFDESQIPSGTDEDIFTIDDNDDAAGDIILEFGTILGKRLIWNAVSSLFEFNDSVRVSGDLEVTGNLILAAKNVATILSPEYPGSTFVADGSDNLGTMTGGSETFSGEEKNLFIWSSRQSSLQDYDILVRYTLPDEFDSFQSNAFGIYFETDGAVTDSKIDFQVEKEGVVGNRINGAAGDDITQNTFGLTQFTLDGGATWNPGDVVLIKVRLYSRDENLVKIGDIEINTVE